MKGKQNVSVSYNVCVCPASFLKLELFSIYLSRIVKDKKTMCHAQVPYISNVKVIERLTVCFCIFTKYILM